MRVVGLLYTKFDCGRGGRGRDSFFNAVIVFLWFLLPKKNDSLLLLFTHVAMP